MRRLLIIVLIIAFLALGPGHARCALDAAGDASAAGVTGATRAAIIDTGFRPDIDGFGFANFGDPEAIGGLGLGALAGGFHDEIFCHTGHCFGMARASVANFEAGRVSIRIPERDAMPEIDRIQTGQSFYYIADFFRFPPGWLPLSGPPLGGEAPDCTTEYMRLLGQLSAGKPAVIGLYASRGDGPGHAVVAYKVERDGDRSYIYVYDPNLPATLHDYAVCPMIAVFDAADGSFLYDDGHRFDELKLDDVDGAGEDAGKMLSVSLLALPWAAIALLTGPPRSRRRP